MIEVHSLRVPDGGCTIIWRSSGRRTMIDVNAERLPDAGFDPLDGFDEVFAGHTLNRYIQSHWDFQHMGGLTALSAHRRVRHAWLPVRINQAGVANITARERRRAG